MAWQGFNRRRAVAVAGPHTTRLLPPAAPPPPVAASAPVAAPAACGAPSVIRPGIWRLRAHVDGAPRARAVWCPSSPLAAAARPRAATPLEAGTTTLPLVMLVPTVFRISPTTACYALAQSGLFLLEAGRVALRCPLSTSGNALLSASQPARRAAQPRAGC